jgi:hypothetical protein
VDTPCPWWTQGHGGRAAHSAPPRRAASGPHHIGPPLKKRESGEVDRSGCGSPQQMTGAAPRDRTEGLRRPGIKDTARELSTKEGQHSHVPKCCPLAPCHSTPSPDSLSLHAWSLLSHPAPCQQLSIHKDPAGWPVPTPRQQRTPVPLDEEAAAPGPADAPALCPCRAAGHGRAPRWPHRSGPDAHGEHRPAVLSAQGAETLGGQGRRGSGFQCLARGFPVLRHRHRSTVWTQEQPCARRPCVQGPCHMCTGARRIKTMGSIHTVE